MLDWKEIHSVEELDAGLDEEILKNRVHRFTLKVYDALGNPLPGVSLKAVHKNHDFTFGVCPNGHISMTNRLACGENEDAIRYWERIGELFNATTLWWGWRVLEPEKGIHTFEEEYGGFGPMERMVRRAEKLGHRLTAHAILYPRDDVSPEWLSRCTEQEAREALERHVRLTVETYKNRIACWHPVNEAYGRIQQAGNLKVNEGLVYQWISELAPCACIIDNGGHTIDPDFYEKGIRNAEHFGGRVDDLGIRGYFELYDSKALPFYQRLWEHYGNLASRYGKGVRFTEIGAASAPRKGNYSPWDVDATTAKELGITNMEEYRADHPITEETQADFLVRMYRMAFAHPELKECTYWDLLDSYTWNEVEGGLLRSDFSRKPAFERLKDLIHREWSTEATLTSGADGCCSFEGFDGEYQVAINGKTVKLHLGQAEPEKVLCI